MKHNYLFTLIVATFISLLSGMLQAQNPPAGGFYGATSKNFNSHMKPAFVYNSGRDFGKSYINDISATGRFIMPCGVNAGGTYYGLMYNTSDGLPDPTGEKPIYPNNIVKVNWNKSKTTTEEVVSDASELPTIFDMAYNYVEKKIYAIYVEAGNQYLVTMTIDEENDMVEISDPITTFTGTKYRTIEFDYNGNLYALYTTTGTDNYGSTVYKVTVDKFSSDYQSVEKTLTPANNYGFGIQQYNREYTYMSAEFDHLSGLLYLVTVTPYNDYNGSSSQTVHEIDVNAENDNDAKKEQYTLQSTDYDGEFNISALSLYIPFTAPEAGKEAASAVTGLKAVAEETGMLKATLTWTNPTTNFGGTDLTSLHSVVVYRDNSKIATITENVTVGGEMTYTDESQDITTGNHTYKVVPCHAEGSEGISAETSLWIGLDIPKSTYPSASKTEDGKGVKISWSAPTEGVNGGLIGTDLKYTVTRTQDNKVIADKISETEVTDTEFPEWSTWNYSVVVNGKGGDSESQETYSGIFIGPLPISVPFTTDYDSYDANEMWSYWPTYQDPDWEESQKMGIKVGTFQSYGDESCYKVDASYYKFEPENLNPGVIDDWRLNNYVISPSLSLPAGVYSVNFKSFIQKAGDVAEFTIRLGSDQTKETQTTILKEFNITAAAADQIDNHTVYFEITEAGEYTVSFHFTSPVVAKSGDSDYHNQGLDYFSITVFDGFSVTGKAVDQDGKAIEDVKVDVTYGSTTESTTTDAEGTYKFILTPEKDVNTGSLSFTKAGYRSGSKDFNYTGGNVTVENQVMEEEPKTKTFTVSGTVVDADNKPVADAEVAVTCSVKNESTKTSADGTFSFSFEVGVETDAVTGTVKVTKNGYKELVKEFSYNGTDNVALGNITLETENVDIPLVYDASGIAEVKVYTVSGIMVRNIKVSAYDNFNIEELNLEPGIYVINGAKRAIR